MMYGVSTRTKKLNLKCIKIFNQGSNVLFLFSITHSQTQAQTNCVRQGVTVYTTLQTHTLYLDEDHSISAW